MWVGGVAPAGVVPPSGRGKVLSAVSLSSVGLEEGAFVASSVVIMSTLVVVPSDAFVAVYLVIGRGSVVLALRLLMIALRALALALRSVAPVTIEAVSRPFNLVLR